MRKVFVTIMLAASMLLLSNRVDAQDWAGFDRYAGQNAVVTIKPKAVLMGDSITDFWYASHPEFFSENNFQGRGISGQTTSQMLVRFRRDVIDLHPEYVVILAGTNDIARNNGIISLESILGNLVSMCELAEANGIKPVLCSVLPASSYGWRPEITDSARQIETLNGMIAEYAASAGIPYVDYHSKMRDGKGGLPETMAGDGVHPNKSGYTIMETILLKFIK